MNDRIKELCVLSVFFLSLSSTCFAATFYVSSSTGNDDNAGTTEGAPWKTLYKASVASSNGDTVVLKRGDTWYVTKGRRPTNWSPSGDGCVEGIGLTFSGTCPGSPTNNVTVGAYGNGAKPVIDGTAKTDISQSKKVPNYAPIVIGGYSAGVDGSFVIRDLDLRGPAGGPAIQAYDGGGSISISNCELKGAGWAAESLLQINGNGNIVEDCLFDQITGNGSSSATTGYGKSIEFFGGSGHMVRRNIFKGYEDGGSVRFANYGTGATIERNFFYHPDTRYSGSASWAWALVIRSCNGGTYIVRNNVFDLTDHGSYSGSNLRAMAFWDDHASTTRKIFNNTIIGDGTGQGTNGSGSIVLVQNNIFYDLDQGLKNPNSGIHLKNNVFYSCNSKYDDSVGSESDSYLTDPNLVNPTMSTHVAGDARIQAPSDAIDGGVNDDPDIPVVDHEGATRDTAVDVGAFEYGGQGSNQPPQASFNALPSSGQAPLTVQFSDTSTDPDGTIASWNWSFGDGATSTEQNPTHTYDNPNTYTAAMTVTDNDGAPDSTSTTISASSGETTSIYVEAESGTLYTPITIGTDPNPSSSGSGYVYAPAGSGDTTNPTAEAVYNVEIPYAGDYYLWVRMYGPSGDNDAMYIGFNGSFDRVFVAQWTEYEWVRVETSHGSGDFSHTLSAGTNQVNIGHGEELARADMIFMTSDAGSSPTDDTTYPVIAIAQPTSSDTHSTDDDTVDLGGSASDDVGVTGVTWTNSRGGTGTASGTGSWIISDIVLHCGDDNIITVTAQDAAGNSGTDALTVDVKPCPVGGLDTP